MYANVFPGGQGPGLRIGIVIKRDGDPDMAGRVKVWLPGKYGMNVSPSHLAYCNVMAAPNAQNQNFSGMTLQNGTMVYVNGETGSPNMMIVGIAGSEVASFDGNPGNMDLLGIISYIQEAFNNDSSDGNNRYRKPNWQDKEERGAKRRTIVERGPFFHRQKNNIPTIGMLPSLAGLITPEVQQVVTATQQTSSIPTESMLNSLPGSIMTITGILQNVLATKKLKRRATENMEPQTLSAFETIVDHMSDGEVYGALDGIRVNPEVFANNAANLISSCTTVADIVNCIQELTCNTSYHGMDQYNDQTFEIEGPFGNTEIILDTSGNITENKKEKTIQALNAFMSLLQSFSGYPSARNGQNLFGESAPTIMNQIGRMPIAMQSQITSMLSATNTEQNPKKADEYTVLRAIQGGLSLLKR